MKKDRKLKIAIIARTGIPVAKTSKGYYARLCYLINDLQKRGHKVTLLGHPKSEIKGKLIKLPVKKVTFENQLYYYSKFFKELGSKFDIINCQTDHVCTFFDHFVKTAVLHTIIYGGFWQEIEEILKLQKHKKYSTVSLAMIKRYPYLNWQGFVYTGVNIKKFKFQKKPKDYYIFFSRVNKEKGADIAIKIAKQTNIKLYIAGRVSEEFYSKEIKPFLSHKIKYLGDLKFKEKIKILQNAIALIHPHRLPEGFSNSFLEAMSCGVPVISSLPGCPKEIISHKKDGWIAKDFHDIVEGVQEIENIDRRSVRKKIEENFTIEKMVDGYEELYNKVVNNSNNNKLI